MLPTTALIGKKNPIHECTLLPCVSTKYGAHWKDEFAQIPLDHFSFWVKLFSCLSCLMTKFLILVLFFFFFFAGLLFQDHEQIAIIGLKEFPKTANPYQLHTGRLWPLRIGRAPSQSMTFLIRLIYTTQALWNKWCYRKKSNITATIMNFDLN